MSPALQAWGLLLLRPALFAGLQAAVALGLLVGGVDGPFRAAGGWWLALVTLGNLVTLVALRWARREAGGFSALWRGAGARWRGDLPWFLGVTLVAGPLG